MSFINMMFAVVGLALMGFVHNNPQYIMPEAFLAIVVLQVILVILSRLMARSTPVQ